MVNLGPFFGLSGGRRRRPPLAVRWLAAVAVGVLVGLVLLVASSLAAQPQPFDPQEAFRRASIHHFGGAWPNCQRIDVTYDADELAPEGRAELDGCRVWFRARDTWWPDWPTFCVTAEHEFGHLLGLEHARGRRNLMTPSTDGRDDELAAPDCYGKRHRRERIRVTLDRARR